jgi:hypothetical protein
VAGLGIIPVMGRPLLIRIAALFALLVAGAVIAGLSDGIVGKAIGFAVGGLAAVLLVALAFYEVGLSEDRDRERGR